jgi:hypothetical protein
MFDNGACYEYEPKPQNNKLKSNWNRKHNPKYYTQVDNMTETPHPFC